MNLLNKTATLLICLLCMHNAQAELADRSKPVNLEADSVTVDDLHKTSIYVGNVMLTQGTLILRADKIEVNENGEGFSKAVAFGNPVYFRQKRDKIDEYVEGYASRIDMDTKANIINLSGNARLKKGEDEMRGNTMTYNTASELFEAKNDPTQASKNPNAPPSRVRVIIRPKIKTDAQPAARPPLPLQSAPSLPSGTP
ncbi:MAG: lipopolysaccharide transport periplasmic protein LptA [Sulfuriferula sp.]|nr:lipopolysaccharide transport periplasmic protein LptA [Sulfuriferula sp.]